MTYPHTPDRPECSGDPARKGHAAEGTRWYLGAQNDGLFIVNAPPSQSNDHPWHDNPNGPTEVLNVTDLPKHKAEKIVELLNRLSDPPKPAPRTSGSYLASLQYMADDGLAYSDDAEVSITVGDVRRMQGDPSSATLLALIAAESDLRNWPVDLPSMGAVRDAIAKLVAGRDAAEGAGPTDCAEYMLLQARRSGREWTNAMRERIAKIVCCRDACILEGCDPGCIACSPEHPLALETADLILAAFSTVIPDGFCSPGGKLSCLHLRERERCSDCPVNEEIDNNARDRFEAERRHPSATGAAEPDAVRMALEEDLNLIGSALSKYRHPSGVTHAFYRIKSVLSAPTPTPGLTIAQIERAAKACRDKYCELMSGEKAWDDLTADERSIAMVSLSAAFSAVSFTPAVGVTREAIREACIAGVSEHGIQCALCGETLHDDENCDDAECPIRPSAPDATGSATKSDTRHYLNAIRVRLETLYAASTNNPRLREQLSDEVDWIDAQLASPQDVGREATIEVPKAALDWLNGEAPDADGKWFGECEPVENEKSKRHKPYWWRSKFRSMIPSLSRNGGGRG